MADDESDESRLSLEPPKLFARKKKASAPETAAEKTPATDPATAPESILEPVPPPAKKAATKKAPARKTTTTRKTPAKKAPVAEKAAAPTPITEAPTAPSPVREPEKASAPEAPLFVDEVEATPAERGSGVTLLDRVKAVATRSRGSSAPGTSDGSPTTVEAPAKEPRPPLVTGYQAAALTGVLVGLATVLLTALTLRGCEAVRGTTSCGGPGFVLLLAIMIAMVLLGGLLLRLFAVSDPVSTSFLAVGLVAVIALLFLINVILSWAMIIVIPLVAVGTFCLSYWVTTTFVDPSETG